MLARFLVGLLSASIVFGLAAASAGADMFTFRDLDSCCSLAGQSAIFTGASGAAAVNDNGDVVGFAIGADGNRHAYLFKNGEFTLLDTIPQPTGSGYADTAPFSYATDVNDSDFIVGASSDDQISRDPFGGTHGVAWEPTATSVSPNPLDYGQLEVDSINDCNFTQGLLDCYTAATNVNAKDDVAGYGEFLENPSGSYCWCTFPWLIPGGNRALKEVGTSEGPAPDTPSTDMLVYDHTGTDYYTSGINDSDQVVVSPDPSTPSNTNTSAIYPGDIPIPFEASRLDGAYHSINDSGEVIGTDESTNLAQIYIKSGTVDTLSPLSGDTQTQAEAINNDGDVVGYSEGAGGCPSAVEWNHTDYTDPIDLNTAAPSRDEELLVATDISNTGVIVGQGGPCSQSTGYTANIDPWELTGGSSQPTSTTIACTPANLPVTQLSACTVTVADTAPSATQTPSGTVTVASSLTGTLSPANHCTLAAAKTAGQATCHLSYTPTEAGAATLTASYSGDGVHATSRGTVTVTASATGPTRPTTAHVKAALTPALSPHGSGAAIGSLLHGGYSFTFTAPSAGRLVIGWYQIPKGAHLARRKRAPKPVLVASVKEKISAAGKVKVRLKLTAAGRKLLAHAKRQKLTSLASFTPAGEAAVTARRNFTVKR